MRASVSDAAELLASDLGGPSVKGLQANHGLDVNRSRLASGNALS